MMRRRIIRLFLPAFLVLALAGLMQWLLHTTPGARFLLERVFALFSGELTIETVRGDFASGLQLQGFSFDHPDVSIFAGTIDTRIEFDVLPPSVVIKSLRVDQILIHIKDNDIGDEPLSETLADLPSPLPLSFERLEVGRVSIRYHAAESAFEGTELSASGQWQKGLAVNDAVLQAGGIEFRAAGNLSFTKPFTVDAKISSWLQESVERNIPAPGIRLESTFSGNLDDLSVQATVDQPALALEGHAKVLLAKPEWSLHVSSDELRWPPGATDSGDATRFAWQQFTADITGILNHYELNARGLVSLEGKSGPGELGDLDVQATGDIDGLRLERLSLSGGMVKLAASGALSWSDEFHIELASEIERFDPGRWIPDWPGDYPVHGTVETTWQQGRLTVPAFNLQVGATDFHVLGSGDFDPAQDVVKADLGWQSLRWPFAADQPALTSELGQLKVSGRPEDWTIAGTVRVQAGDWPQGNLQLTGHGNLESARVQVQQGEVLGGQFAGEASYRWADERPWSADFTASNLDITALAGGYPLVISGNVQASGQAQDNSLNLDIRKLTGRAHGQPLEATGAIAFEAGLVQARDLRIQSGSSRLSLDGNMRDAGGIRFSGQIESLAAFFDEAGGSIAGEGRISLDPARPVLELEAEGKDLAWQDWRLAEFSAGRLASEDEGSEDDFAQQLKFTGLAIEETVIDEISVRSHGQLPFEHIRIDARRDDTQLAASVSGALQNWQSPSSARWDGLLESMRLSNEEAGYLELEQPARFVLERGAAVVEPACFKGSRKGRWCADMNWTGLDQKDRGHLVANASLDAVSLNLVRLYLGTDLEFTQTLNGTLHWEKLPGSSPAATVQIRLSEGQVISADESATLQTGPGLFGFNIENGKLRAGNMDFTIPEAGSIDMDFSAPDISRGVDSPLEGRMLVSFSGFEPFLPWLNVLDQADGAVNADIKLAGTFGNPQLTGHASLVRGRIEHLGTGLVLNDITLAGAVFEDNHTELNGSFTAGEGTGRIVASVIFDRILKPQVSLKITGTNLTLIDVPDMSIKIDPDLDLQWYDRALKLNGSVRVPQAQISPRYLPTASTEESADLVIIAGQLPPTEKSIFDRSRLRITGSVAVELGQDVTLTLDRATAKFQGTTVFKWNNELLPIGDGSYSVTGKIAAYGQSLDISQGKISFPRVAANNPRLDIHAERQIYGNVQVKQAGILIGGTLKRPVLETYTRPATTEERALALLVTGHDFDYEQGVGAVEVGMYIAPKLYVSYGIGLFDNDSVVSVRYDLGRGFGVKATSSQRQSGGDITYTIER